MSWVLKLQSGEAFIDALNRAVFYRDITRHGGLPQALDASLQKLGSDLRVRARSLKELEDNLSGLAAWLQEEYRPRLTNIQMDARAGSERYVHISSADRGRLFRFWCWNRWLGGWDAPALSIDRGVCLATGAARSLTKMARAVDRWVGSDCTAAALASEFRFVRAVPGADMYERGDEAEGTWQALLSAAAPRHLGLESEWFDEFLIAAAKRPQLRQLFPDVGGHMVSFSRCTRYPFTKDIPLICRGSFWVKDRPTGCDAAYAVVSRDGDHQTLGRGDGEEAADLVVRHLPGNCGPAVNGTARDLARQTVKGPQQQPRELDDPGP